MLSLTAVVVLSGCGGASFKSSASTASVGNLAGLNCANNSITGPGTVPCTLTLSAAAPTGGLTLSLSSNNAAVIVPATVTVPAGATKAAFAATVASVTTTQTATINAATSGAAQAFAIQLLGATQATTSSPDLSDLTCVDDSITGAANESCAVALTAAAPTGGLALSLSSDNAAVKVPASVAVSSGLTTANFTANISVVSTTQTATLTATNGKSSKTKALKLNGANANATPVANLSINTTSIAFGSVTLNTIATQSVTLTSSGTLPVTVSSGAIAGTGFSLTSGTFPIVLNPGQSVTLNIQFDPTVAGAASGMLTLASNSASSPTLMIPLSGTGASGSHEVDLSWNAPTSSAMPVIGYNVYRTTSGTSSYQQLNTSPVTATTYVDLAVQSGQSFDYTVRSVDTSGATSAPSNITTASIP